MAGRFRRELSDRLPLPLAQLYLRACNAKPPRDCHDNAFYLFEAAIKLATATQVAVYRAQGVPDSTVDGRLVDLDRPAFGHWIGWLRDIAVHTARYTPHPFPEAKAVSEVLFSMRKDLPAIHALLVAMAERVAGVPRFSRDKRRLRFWDLIETLGVYRNQMSTGHAAVRLDTFYNEMAERLLAAVEETFAEPVLFGQAELVYVEEVRETGRGREIGILTLMGTNPLRETLTMSEIESVKIKPRAGRLHWRAENRLFVLPPLVVWDPETAAVLFLNESLADKRIEYLNYATGEIITSPRLLAEHGPELGHITERGPTVKDRETVQRNSEAVAVPRVTILYKRHAQPDEQILRWLETQLKDHGYSIFIDRHLAIGEEWAREIVRQVLASDVVIPLLSVASVTSEMLTYEIETAHDAFLQQGKPRLLPVRLNYTDPLPAELAYILDPLEYFLWKGPEDHQPLVRALLEALGDRRTKPTSPLELPAGAVPLDSQYYVVRASDEAFRAALQRRDSTVLIKGARQMGKTSLLARGLQQARDAGFAVAVTDFQKLNLAHFASLETFYQTLGELLADQLDLAALPDETWNVRRGANINFERYVRREVLGKLTAPLLWVLDEVDRLFTCSFSNEVFGLFRTWHNERALDPGGPWRQLTMAIAYATEAHLFITDLNQSPFNIGTRIELADFTVTQVADLNRRYGSPLGDDTAVASFCDLIGGQPYLTRRGLHALASRESDLPTLLRTAGRDEGPFGDHLRRLLVLLVQDAALCEAMREVLRDRPCPDLHHFYRLRPPYNSVSALRGT